MEQQDRRIEERRVDPEPDHRHEPEEAVEEEQEERHHEEADDRRLLRLGERVLTERGGDVGALCSLELHRQRTGLQHERELLGVPEPTLAHVDLRAVVTGDAVGVAHEVDVRHRLDLAVEDDREVLRALLHRLSVTLALAHECARSASRRVIVWKIFFPLFVNCISTTGPFDWGSISARVPESFSSRPVISGIGLFALSLCLRR